MNIKYTKMSGFGPTAWNHGGPRVEVLIGNLKEAPYDEQRTQMIDVSENVSVSKSNHVKQGVKR